MTTANLSVGVDTTKAKADLLQLRKEMEGQPHTLLLNVNTAALNKEITGWIDRKKFQVTLGGGNLKNIGNEIQEVVTTSIHNAFAKPRQISWGAEKFRGDLNASFNRAFENKTRFVGYDRAGLISQLDKDVAGALGANHHVGIASAHLTEQVRKAVADGLVGGVVRVGGAVTPAAAAAPAVAAVAPVAQPLNPSALAAIARTINAALMPAVDELSKAAMQIAATAKKTAVTGSAGGALKASESISAKNSEGFTVGYRRTLDEPGKVLGNIQQLLDDREAVVRERKVLATKQSLVNQRLTEIGKSEVSVERDRLLTEQGVLKTKESLLNQQLAEIGKNEAGVEKERLLQEQRVVTSRQALLDQRLTEIGKSEAGVEKERLLTEQGVLKTKESLLNQRLTEIGKSEAGVEKERLLQEQRVNTSRQALLNQRLAEIGKSETGVENERLLSERRALQTKESLLNQRLTEIGKNESGVEKERVLQEQRVLTSRQSLLNQRLAEIGKTEEGVERERLMQEQRVVLTRQSLLDQRMNEIGKREADVAAAGRTRALDSTSFRAPQLEGIKQLESQLRKVRQAEDLVAQGHPELAIKKFGQSAVDAVPSIGALEAQINTLRSAMGKLPLEQTRRLGNIAATAKANARDAGYNPQGQLIAAYNAVKASSNDDVAKVFFNNEWLSQNQGNLENFRVKAKVTADDVAQSMRRAMAAVDAAARYSANANLTGRGKQIAGAVAVIQNPQLGAGVATQPVKDYIGNPALVADAQAVIAGTRSLKDYERAHREVAPAVNASRAAHKALTGVMNEGHSAARGLAGSMGAMWATYGSVAPLVAAAAIGTAFRQVITVGKDLEYQLTFVSALSDKTAVSTDRLAQAIAGSAVGPVKAAEAMRGLAQNGLDVNQAFMALPAILSLATAGEMTLSDAALGATGVMAAFSLNVSDLGRVSDVFAKAAAMSNTDVKGMVESMKQASTVGDQYGVSLEETGASLALMAKRNIVGTSAGTAFRNMMKEMASPTKEARKAIDDLGLKFFDINGKLLPLSDNLAQIKLRLSGLNEESRIAFVDRIFGERGGKAANAILSDLDAFGTTLDTLKNKSKGFSQDVTDMLSAATDGRIKVMFSEFQTEAARAFDGASGGINNFVEAIRGVVKSDGFKSAISSIVSGVTRLTTFLIEQGSAVVTLLGIWAGFKALSFVITMYSGIRAAILANNVAMTANAAAAAATAAGTAAAGAAAGAATVPVWGLAAASRGLLAALTGGLSLIIGLAIEFLVLSRNTDQATESEQAHRRATENGNLVLDERLGKMRLENGLLAEKNMYMNSGMSEAEADAKVAAGSKKKVIRTADDDIANATTGLQAAKGRKADADAVLNSLPSGDGSGAMQAIREATIADNDIKEWEKGLKSSRERKSKLLELDAGAEITARDTTDNNRLKAIADFEKKKREAKEAKIDVSSVSLPAMLNDKRISNGSFDQGISDANKALDLLKEKRALPTTEARGKADTVGKANLMAEIDDRKAQYERDVRNVEASYKAQDVILKARQQAGLVSMEEYELRTNLIAERHSKERVTMAQREYEDIQKIAKDAIAADAKLPAKQRRLTEADKSKIDRDLENAKAKANEAAANELERAAVAAIKIEGALKKTQEHAAEFQMTAALRDMKALRDMAAGMQSFNIGSNQGAGPQAMNELYGAQYIAGVRTAGMTSAEKAAIFEQKEETRRSNAESALQKKFNSVDLKGKSAQDKSVKAGMAAYDEYTPEIISATKAIMSAQVMLDDLNQRRQALTEKIGVDVTPAITSGMKAELDVMDKSAIKLADDVENTRKALESVEKLRQNSVNVRSDAAKKVYEYETSPEAGLNTFWKQYRDEAGDSAKMVNNIMSQSFSSMEQGLMQFVTTGKLNFKSLVGSILADAARMMANKAISQLLSMGLNWAIGAMGGGGSFGSSMNTYDTGGASYTTGAFSAASTYSANGNVVDQFGAVPLKKFAAGGIAHGPMNSILGEGSLPEANVPLQDGRSIPVTLSGGGGGGDTAVSISVHVDSNGKSAVESDASGNKAAQLGKMVETGVMQIITREKRPGGLLYSA